MTNVHRNYNERVVFPFLSENYEIENCRFKKYRFRRQNVHVSNKTHFHISTEIHFVQEGCMHYAIGEESITLSSGEYLILFPNTVHRRVDTAPNSVTYHVLAELRGDVYAQCAGQGYRFGKVTQDMAEKLNRLDDFFEKHHAVFHLESSVTLFQLICDLLPAERGHTLGAPAAGSDDTRLLLAKQYIKEHILQPPRCEEVAVYCNVSPKQLSRIFLRYEAMTTKAYINRCRFEVAERMLTTGDMAIKQISEELGFCNENYFNKFFKKYAGACPGAYRDCQR